MSKLYPCVNCTEDGYCKKYSDEEVKAWCVQGPCKDERPSNADRIRAMADEELAEVILGLLIFHLKTLVDVSYTKKEITESLINWLKQEAYT